MTDALETIRHYVEGGLDQDLGPISPESRRELRKAFEALEKRLSDMEANAATVAKWAYARTEDSQLS